MFQPVAIHCYSLGKKVLAKILSSESEPEEERPAVPDAGGVTCLAAHSHGGGKEDA